LEEALRALEDDHAFLLAGVIFTEELIQQWIRYKWEYEAYPVRNRPHPYEMRLYFDV
jgi:glutamine synthetase